MFVRACKLTGMQGDQRTDGELLKDVQELRSALEGELRVVSGAASGEVPGSAGAALWLGSEEAEAAASALRPKLANAQKAIEALLIEVVTLEVHSFPTHSFMYLARNCLSAVEGSEGLTAREVQNRLDGGQLCDADTVSLPT